jgi:hypothetical protein
MGASLAASPRFTPLLFVLFLEVSVLCSSRVLTDGRLHGDAVYFLSLDIAIACILRVLWYFYRLLLIF